MKLDQTDISPKLAQRILCHISYRDDISILYYPGVLIFKILIGF